MICMKFPLILSTTEIQRKTSVLSTLPDDQLIVVTKGTQEIGVYVPMALAREMLQNSQLTIPGVKS